MKENKKETKSQPKATEEKKADAQGDVEMNDGKEQKVQDIELSPDE